MNTLAMIGLGSNLGDRRATLDNAIDALKATPNTELCAVSTYHETAPIGGPRGQGPYLNAAAAIHTTLSAIDLLIRLREIEAAEGRVRKEEWGPRTLDLDLIYFGQQTINQPEKFAPPPPRPFLYRFFDWPYRPTPRSISPALRVPHPSAQLRRFVLAPLAEIAPDFVPPGTKKTIRELLAHLDRRPSFLVLANCWHDPRQDQIVDRVCEALGADLISARAARDAPVPSWWDALPKSESRQRDLELLEAWGHRLSAEPWDEHVASWVVADFGLDDLPLNVDMFGYYHGGHDDMGEHNDMKEHLLFMQDAAEEWRHRIREPTLLLHNSSYPMFTQDYAIREILAACAQTRS